MLIWIVLTALLLPVLLVLFIPFSFTIGAGKADKIYYNVTCSWLWNGISLCMENKKVGVKIGRWVIKSKYHEKNAKTGNPGGPPCAERG